MEEVRYSYKIFTMDEANDIIYNTTKPIDWMQLLNGGKSFIKLGSDIIPTTCIKRVSEVNVDNKELRKTLQHHEREKVKAITYKVTPPDLSLTLEDVGKL